MPGPRKCFVCSTRPITDLYIDPRGFYLLACSDDRCIRPPLTEPYQWVMSAEDHLACRQMLNEQRRKLVGGDDKFHPIANSLTLPRWDPNR